MSNGKLSAFPIDPNTLPNMSKHEADGLTKRELFAAMAMQGLLADPESGPATTVAQVAVNYADALLAALEKQA